MWIHQVWLAYRSIRRSSLDPVALQVETVLALCLRRLPTAQDLGEG